MTRDEAKEILLLYRQHDTADADDPQIAEALALAKKDSELKHWLVRHCAQQFVLREKFRQIAAPAGLKEQIISEHVAQAKSVFWRRHGNLLATAAVAVMVVLLSLWLQPREPNNTDTFPTYRSRMVGVALRGYAMDLTTNDAAQIRAWLAENHAPADYALPAALQKADLVGCGVQSWENAKVSMICFRTGKPLPPGEQSDLWLFVIDRASVKNAPASKTPQFSKVNRLITAVWMQGDKLYVLGTEGDESVIKKFL